MAPSIAETREERKAKKIKKRKLQTENNEAAKAEVGVNQASPRSTKNRSKKHKKTEEKNEGKEEMYMNQRKNSFITDARFSLAQLDPRFQRMPKREAKVQVDSRFARMLSDPNFSSSSAPVDKRGKEKKRKEVNPLLRYYLHEKEPEVDRSLVEVDRSLVEMEEENESTISTSSGGCNDESTSTTDDEDDEDDNSINSDICRYLIANHENIPITEQETHRLAIVNMDWDHIKSVDLYVVMSSCLPKGGKILSVTIYPSEFGLKCMEVESLHGPASLMDDNGEQSDEEPDPEVINERLRAYELNKLRYYYAVATFDSSATANHVYNILDGTELTRTSNVFDLRFVPDSMDFKHPSRDLTTVAPTNYTEPDFQTRALQHNKVKLTWEDDEPKRVKTLRQKFNAEKLDDLNEYLASTDSSDEEHGDAEKLRSLLDRNDSDADQNDYDKDMEITFNTGLEDLSKRILEKKDKKSETVWEQVLRKRNEKRKAKKNWSKKSSDSEESDYDVKAPEQPDDFFIEESSETDFNSVNKFSKASKVMLKSKKVREHAQKIEKEQEASKAELELLFAEDKEIEKGPKGYNIKSKEIMGKNGKKAVEKLSNVDYSNDVRFSALFNSHLYALDPTDPQYKRCAAFAQQRIHKQIGESCEKRFSSSSVDENNSTTEPAPRSENENHQLSSIIRSLKRNIGSMKK